MSTLVNAAMAIALTLIFSWVVFFGGVGGILARTRGGSSLEGLLWGAALGPIGWIFVWFRTRRNAFAQQDDFDSAGDSWGTL